MDFAPVNRVIPGDIVITQDYGLATMCLARRARVLNQNGLEYTARNIDGLLGLRQVLFAKRVPVKQEVKPPVAVWLEQTVR